MKEDIVLQNEILTVKIHTLGAELCSIKKGGEEYIWQADPTVWGFSAPVLFPVCGRIQNDTYTFNGKSYNMGRHGFARFSEFNIEKADKSCAVLSLSSSEETKKAYPFEFKFNVNFELKANKLNITYSVYNPKEETIYFSFGGHEGFSCPEGAEEYSVTFTDDNSLVRYMVDGGFYNGETEHVALNCGKLQLKYSEFEKCTYIFRDFKSDSVILENKDSTRKVKVSFDKPTVLALWTLEGRKYLCIEPWWGSSQDMDFNGDFSERYGVISLEPNKTYAKTHSIEIL